MKPNKHILIVSQYFWPENFRINDLVLGLQEKGYKITVLTGKPNYPEGKFFQGYNFFNRSTENYHGVKVVRSWLFPRGKGGITIILNFLSFVIFGSITALIRCRDKYDAIFVYEPSPVTVCLPAIVLKKIKKIPIIFWVQDLWPETLSATGVVKSKKILNMVGKVVDFIYNSCDLILAQSHTFVKSIEERGISKEKIKFYPNSAEEFYKPITIESNSEENKQIPKGFIVMFAGSIGVSQDFPTILAAAAKLKDSHDIHFVVLGEGRIFSWVQDEIEKQGLNNVHLLGRYPSEKMPRYFSLADAMLVTLRKEPIFALTIPAKVQSYIACAKPIIAALDGEGGRVIEEAGAGITVPAENPDRLADAVLKMHTMTSEERDKMGNNGRKYFESNFDRDMLIIKLDKWIEELINHGK